MLPHPFLPFALLSSLLIFNYFGACCRQRRRFCTLNHPSPFPLCAQGTLLDLYEKDTGGHADPWQVVLWALCFSLAWNVTVVLIAVRHRFRMKVHAPPYAQPCAQQICPKVWALALCTGIICLLGCVPLTSIWTDLMDRATMLLGVAVGTALLNVFAFVLGTERVSFGACPSSPVSRRHAAPRGLAHSHHAPRHPGVLAGHRVARHVLLQRLAFEQGSFARAMPLLLR